MQSNPIASEPVDLGSFIFLHHAKRLQVAFDVVLHLLRLMLHAERECAKQGASLVSPLYFALHNTFLASPGTQHVWIINYHSVCGAVQRKAAKRSTPQLGTTVPHCRRRNASEQLIRVPSRQICIVYKSSSSRQCSPTEQLFRTRQKFPLRFSCHMLRQPNPRGRTWR